MAHPWNTRILMVTIIAAGGTTTTESYKTMVRPSPASVVGVVGLITFTPLKVSPPMG